MTSKRNQHMARRLTVAALIATLLAGSVSTAAVSTVSAAEGPPRCCT